jgi:hypothetical protein
VTQRIEVPGIGVVEFPDGMTDDQIASAIKANSPQESGAQKLAKETGVGEAIMVGAGAKTNDILNGLTQLYLKATGDTKALGGLKTNVEEGKSLYYPLAKERPIATGVGSALPAMAVPGAGAGYGGAALAGAIPELLSYGSAEERLGRGAVGAVGGVAGRAIGSGITNLLKPAGSGVNANAAAMEAAGRIGYRPLAGQATQNPALLNVENYLARTPGSSGTMQTILRENQKAVNRAAASSIGQNADDVSASVLNAAEKSLGADFQRLQSVTAPQLGDDFVSSLVKIEESNAARSAFRDPQIDSLLEKAMDLAAKGNLSGTAYKEIRTELSGQATKAFKGGDATLGQAVKTVREALDDAAEKSLSKADQEAWRVARTQWGNWKTLTKGLVAEAGDVSPARVAAQLRNQPGFRTGNLQGPLADVARIGEGVKGALNPNSGSLTQGMLYGNPLTGVPLAASNYLGAKVYTNPVVQKYLREGLLDIGKNGELIVKATGVPLGVAGTKSLLGVE